MNLVRSIIILAILASTAISIPVSVSLIQRFFETGLHEVESSAQQRYERSLQLKEQGDYKTCIQELEQISVGVAIYEQAQVLLDDCQKSHAEELLKRAEKLALEGYYKDAIATLCQIPSSLHDHLIREKIREWTTRIRDIFEEVYWQEGLEKVNAIASTLPQDNPLYREVQTLIKQWANEWKDQLCHIEAAEVALAKNDWETARKEIAQVPNPHPLFRQRVSSIQDEIQNQQYQQHLDELIQKIYAAISKGDFEAVEFWITYLPDEPEWEARKAELRRQIEAARERMKVARQRNYTLLFLLFVSFSFFALLPGRFIRK